MMKVIGASEFPIFPFLSYLFVAFVVFSAAAAVTATIVENLKEFCSMFLKSFRIQGDSERYSMPHPLFSHTF